MTNEEKAVIDAARAVVSGHLGKGGLEDALHVLEKAPTFERKFWISYSLAGGREGHTTVAFTGQLTQDRVQEWANWLGRQFGVSVVIRTFTELEG